MRSLLSFPAKRELLIQTANRYQTASHLQKSIILDEVVAATGYARKYAIRLLTHPVPPIVPIKRPRGHHYGPVIQEALVVAWRAANGICAKRLVPFSLSPSPPLSGTAICPSPTSSGPRCSRSARRPPIVSSGRCAKASA